MGGGVAPWWLSGKESACQCGRCGFSPWVGKIPWRRKWQPTPVFLPGKSHGQRSLVGYSPWGCKEWDMTEQHQALSELSLGKRVGFCLADEGGKACRQRAAYRQKPRGLEHPRQGGRSWGFLSSSAHVAQAARRNEREWGCRVRQGSDGEGPRELCQRAWT